MQAFAHIAEAGQISQRVLPVIPLRMILRRQMKSAADPGGDIPDRLMTEARIWGIPKKEIFI